MIWIWFVITAAILVYAASKMTVYADALADHLGLTKSWVGLLLVGLVTSLPELATTVSSVVEFDAPDLAVGNIVGSVLFNLAILGMVDLMFRRGGLARCSTSAGNILSATVDLLLLCVLMAGMIFPLGVQVVGLNFGFGSLLLIVLGISGFALCYIFEHKMEHRPVDDILPEAGASSKNHVMAKFSLAAVVVVVCGYGLAMLGDQIAKQTGLTQSFVGTLFLALATSLPELTVSVTAVRMKAYDLLLGNILGSNIINVMILALSDFVYTKEAFYVPQVLGWGQIYSGLLGAVATCLVLIALVFPKRELKGKIGFESWGVLLLYLLCMLGLYFEWGRIGTGL